METKPTSSVICAPNVTQVPEKYNDVHLILITIHEYNYISCQFGPYKEWKEAIQ